MMLCYHFVCLIVLLILNVLTTGGADNRSNELNEFDTYNVDECGPRIRRPWHLMKDDERNLYISGLLALRRADGDVALDDLASIASVHGGSTRGTVDHYINAVHQSSSNNYWHSYILYELESRIRNLGGEWACFAMPYYDVTQEHGREDDPFIFTTGLGGDGNVDDHYAVNGYSWNVTIGQYWVASACLAEHDSMPLCSLKRALRPMAIPDAATYGDLIINNPNYADFGRAYWDTDNFGGLFTNFPNGEGYQNNMGWEPIWPLYHSFVQYHQSIWTVCHGYDEIANDELEDYEDAYVPFLDYQDYDDYIALELDEPMLFGGMLPYKEWSWVHDNELTIRKMYDMPKWNIKYDLLDGSGFYKDSGLKEFCADRLNEDWFILAENDEEEIRENENMNEEKVEVAVDAGGAGMISSSSSSSPGSSYVNELALAIGAMLTVLCVALWRLYANNKANKVKDAEADRESKEWMRRMRKRVRPDGYGSTI